MKYTGNTNEDITICSRLVTGHHENELIDADNVHFENCTLKNCIIIYSGGDVSWVNLRHDKCTFRFLGHAQKTITFLRGFQTGKKKSGSIDMDDLIPANEHLN